MAFLKASAVLHMNEFVFDQVSLRCQVFHGLGFMGLDDNTIFLSL